MVGSPSGGTGGLTITENDGGGIGIQGENPNRIDGLNYGTDNATSTPETLTWTLSAPPGLVLNFVDWSHADGTAGDIEVSNGTTENDFQDLSGAAGTSTLSGISLTDGGSLTVREIPDAGLTTGAAVAGFTFSIAAGSGDPGFDNGGGDNLWTNATNWNPDGLPVAPDDAIIDGHDVIVDRAVASSPAELRISDGSLTIRGSGSLPLASMSIGEMLESQVRLVLEGSTCPRIANSSWSRERPRPTTRSPPRPPPGRT